MEFDDNRVIEQQEEDSVEIYSRKAIFWFFFLLGPLFGGVLLMLNLKEAGYKKAINSVLLFVVLFDVLSEILIRLLIKFCNIDILGYQKKLMNYKPGDVFFDPKIALLMAGMLALKIAGALVLTRYFFKKYFPENDYYAKPVLNVLFISIMVWIILQFIGLAGI